MALPALGAREATAPLFRRWIALRLGAGNGVRVSRLTGANKLTALHDCILGPLFAEEHKGMFPFAGAVMEQVEMVCVERPSGKWSVDELVQILTAGEARMHG